jgi:hypothetical protein
MNWAISLAAAITFAAHTFAGGQRVAVPLLADTHLPKASKWLSYYCWHVVTVLLAFISAAFALLAIMPEPAVVRAAQLFFGAFCLVASALSAFVAVKGGINPLRFPSTSLFALIALLCGFALATS